jgi:hypothetical protein
MSDEHRKAVARGMSHSRVPADPAGHIRRTTTGDAELSGNDRRIVGARRGAAKGSGKAKFAGAFDLLKTALFGATDISKSLQPGEPLRAETIRMNDFSTADLIRGLKATPVSTLSLIKSIKPAMDKLAKSLGVDSPLEAGYGSDSASLTGGAAMREQSLDGRLQSTVVPMPVKRLTKTQIERASKAALEAGVLTGAEANCIATCLSMDMQIDPALLAKLAGIGSNSK